jgi:hypothetical protein
MGNRLRNLPRRYPDGHKRAVPWVALLAAALNRVSRMMFRSLVRCCL